MKKLKDFGKLIGIPIAILLLYYTFRKWDIDIVTTIYEIKIHILIIGILIYWLFLLVRTLRFYSLVTKHDSKVDFLNILHVQITSNLFGQVTIGKSGEALKVFLVNKRYGLNLKEVGSIFAVEKIMDFSIFAVIAFLSIAFIGMDVFKSLIPNNTAYILLIFIFLGILFVLYYLGTRGYKLKENINLIIYSVFSHILLFGITYMSFFSFGMGSIQQIFVIYAISAIIGLISLLPGGRGASELSAMAIATTLYRYNPNMVMPALIQILLIGYGGSIIPFLIVQIRTLDKL
jgi:uncharacterized membrane protein YbhN (UPF0104 family)